MMKIGKIRGFAALLAASSVICFASMCFLIDDGGSYANAENMYSKEIVSAIAENSERPYTKGKMEFDDSVWGRLATLMQDMLEAWHP